MKKAFYLSIGLVMATITGMAQNHWPEHSVQDLRGRTHSLSDYASEKELRYSFFGKPVAPRISR